MMRNVLQRTPRKVALAGGVAIALALGLTACVSDEEAGGSGEGTEQFTIQLDPALREAAVAKAAEIAEKYNLSGSVEVVGDNSGYEAAVIEAVYAPFSEGAGVDVTYTYGGDVFSTVRSRVNSGNAPDVVTLAAGTAREFVAEPGLLNLSEFMQEELEANFSASVLEASSVDGSVYGVFQGFNNFQMWINPSTYTGPADGASWADVQAWTEQLGADGTAAWCSAQEAGGSSGFPGSQLIEELFVKKYGAEKLAAWGRGDLAWTSPEVKDAWQMFGALVGVDAQVAGGVAGALSTGIGTGYAGLVAEPVTCQAAIWGTWTAGLIGAAAPEMEPGVNLDFMQVPASDPQFANHEMFFAALTYAFSQTDETKAFMEYLGSAEFQSVLASADQWVVSSSSVSIDAYGSPLLKKVAEVYINGDVTLAGGPNTLAPTAVSSKFYSGVMEFLGDQSKLDAILEDIEAASAEAQG